MENVQVREKEKDKKKKKKKKKAKNKNQPLKTQQSSEEGEDRISSLPDCLIHEILSRVFSTKQTIRTGTLSKRWQHVWPFVPCLSFSSNDFKAHPSYDKNIPLPDFYLAVDKTLNKWQSNNLNRFDIYATYDESFESHVSKWIQFVTSNNFIQVILFLVCHEGPMYELKDDSFFDNSDFIYLQLFGCLLKPTKPISWNNLTTLIIMYVKVDHDLIENILSGSPLLANLILVNCYGYSYLDITSKSVERLVIDGYDDGKGEDCVLVINAPFVSSLTIKGKLWLFFFSLRDVSSVVEAKLDYHMIGYHGNPDLRIQEEEILNRLISNLSKVKELEIGSSCYEVLARLEVRGFIFPSNLKGVDVASNLYSLAHSKALVDCRDIDDSSDRDAFDSDAVESRDSEAPVLRILLQQLQMNTDDSSDSDAVESRNLEEPVLRILLQ